MIARFRTDDHPAEKSGPKPQLGLTAEPIKNTLLKQTARRHEAYNSGFVENLPAAALQMSRKLNHSTTRSVSNIETQSAAVDMNHVSMKIVSRFTEKSTRTGLQRVDSQRKSGSSVTDSSASKWIQGNSSECPPEIRQLCIAVHRPAESWIFDGPAGSLR